MPANFKIFTIPIQIDGEFIFDLSYAHGESVSGQVTVALANAGILYELEIRKKNVDYVDYIPTSYINIITKDTK